MNVKEFIYKANAYLRRKLIRSRIGRPGFYDLYPSYRHWKRAGKAEGERDFYLASRPNPGAGIGHQMANWLSGYKMACYYGVKYAVYPFSYLNAPFEPNEWDAFLGLNEGETSAESLYRKGYRKVILPKIEFSNAEERDLLKNIIDSYTGKVVFLLEMDQFADSELESLDYLRKKYYAAPARKNDRTDYDPDCFNVAVHIRRGDIVQTDPNHLDDNLTMRWMDTDYYIEQTAKYAARFAEGRPVHLYLFSQADKEELAGFEPYGTVHYCNQMSALESFLYMVNADMLIMSRSGMSYQAAKLNLDGIIIYPQGFWREPVDSEKWILPE